MKDKLILDACCGSKMFYFDKDDSKVLFADIRRETHVLCDGRTLNVNPDVIADFTKMPFPDSSFKMVVFDPPHLNKIGKEAWMAKKYGVLSENWRDDLRKGFSECFRVLQPFGTLIFKWNENQIKVSEVLKLTPEKPIIGHKTGKSGGTHWLVFMKLTTPPAKG